MLRCGTGLWHLEHVRCDGSSSLLTGRVSCRRWTKQDMLQKNQAIYSAKMVREKMLEQDDLDVSEKQIRGVMRRELRMGYRLAKTVPIQSNSERCLVLRQQYALKMLPLLESGRRIINVDESWLNGTHFVRRVWAPANAPATVADKQVAPRLSLIVALDTDGKIWFALT